MHQTDTPTHTRIVRIHVYLRISHTHNGGSSREHDNKHESVNNDHIMIIFRDGSMTLRDTSFNIESNKLQQCKL